MERGLRSLIWLSRMIRNRKILSNYAATTRSMQRGCASYGQRETKWKEMRTELDKPGHDMPESSEAEKTEDGARATFSRLMTENRGGVQDPNYMKLTQIYDAIKSNSRFITVSTAISMLTALRWQKHIHDELKKRNEFFFLCEKINKGARELPIPSIVHVFKTLHIMRVESDTVIMQTLMQLLKVSLNEIPMKLMVVVYSALSYMKPVPLVNALRKSMPRILVEYADEIVLLSVASQIDCLRAAYKNNDPEVIDIVMRSLLNYERDISIGQCILILRVASQIPPSELNSNFCSFVQNKLVQLMKDSKFPALSETLAYSVNKIQEALKAGENRTVEFETETVLDPLINIVATRQFGLKQNLAILSKLNLIRYSSISLLDCLAAQIYTNPEVCRTLHFKSIISFVSGLSIADYKPILWDCIVQVLLQNALEKNYTDVGLCRFAMSLGALDTYDEELLKTIFEMPVRCVNQEKVKLDVILHLYQSVKTLYPAYTGPWPSPATLDMCVSSTPKINRSIVHNMLELALGGSAYVKSNLTTKFLHSIDHMVVIHRNGHPVAIDDISDTSIEDIKLPPNSNAILLYYFPSVAYCLNTKRLHSKWMLKVRSVEAHTGYSVVVINYFVWNNLQESEKIAYLKQAINLRANGIIM